MSHVEALQRAIAIVGSQQKLAEAIKAHGGPKTVSQQTISFWVNSETLIGPEWWGPIESATARKVSRRDLRPDLYLPEERMRA